MYPCREIHVYCFLCRDISFTWISRQGYTTHWFLLYHSSLTCKYTSSFMMCVIIMNIIHLRWTTLCWWHGHVNVIWYTMIVVQTITIDNSRYWGVSTIFTHESSYHVLWQTHCGYPSNTNQDSTVTKNILFADILIIYMLTVPGNMYANI